MKLPLFRLEDYFAKWEFTAPHSMCFSDAESFGMDELLAKADAECQTLWSTLRLGYTHTQGHPLLLQELTKLYGCQEEQMVCTAGAEEGIFAAMQALIEPGDHVIIVRPCYESLANLPKALGADISELFLDAKDGWKLDLDKLKAVLRANTKLIVLNYPHSPTGAILTFAEQTVLIELARKNGTYIFCDEVYRLLEFDPKETLPPFATRYEKAISLAVMSKVYGLAGLRIGWLVSHDVEFIQRVKNIKHYLTICNSAPSEILALIALRNSQSLLQRNREIIKENMQKLSSFLERMSDLVGWQPPRGGCTALVELKIEEPAELFIQKLVQKAGILLLPGSVYGCEGSFRVGYARKSFPEVLQNFETYLKKSYR